MQNANKDKKVEENKEKPNKKTEKGKEEEIILKPTDEQAMINKQKERENTRNMKILLVFAGLSIIVVAGGYAFYKKR